MHEFPITQQIVKIAEENALKNNAKRVVKITLVVGELAGFVGDSISMYFDVISQGTLAEGAELELKFIPAKYKCEACEALFEREPLSYQCPGCGGQGRPTDIGKEFYIEAIEVDV